jgi:hypothetical protein
VAKKDREENEVIVLTDDQGNTYLLDRFTLYSARVPDERRDEVDEALREGEAVGGALRVTPTETDYKLAGSYRIQHTGGLKIAEILRSL